MRGVGVATAAATVVNALPTGIGAAIGLDLPVTATVEVDGGGTDGTLALDAPVATRSPLASLAVERALARYSARAGGTVRLALDSPIPPARGLKSSSAVASAIVLAVAHASGREPEAPEVARLSAEIGRAAGVSATGAFDDALAGLCGGYVVTDNRRNVLIAAGAVGPGLDAVALIPPERHPPSPEWGVRFAAEADAGRRAATLARSGDWSHAMRINSDLVERVMGYSRYPALRSGLERAGAIASGVSGLGPALVAFAPPSRIAALVEVLASVNGERRRLALSRLPPARASWEAE